MEDQSHTIKITSTKHLHSFAERHTLDGNIISGTECVLERNARTALIKGKIVIFDVVPVANDYTGMGKYMNRDSFAMVIPEGCDKAERWPLTMIYFEKQ